MQLSEYLTKMGLTEPEFAQRINVSQPTVNRYVNGKRMPDFNVIRRIEAATDGAVGVTDWYFSEPAQESTQ